MTQLSYVQDLLSHKCHRIHLLLIYIYFFECSDALAQSESVGYACWRLIACCHGLGALDAHPFSQKWQTAQIHVSPHIHISPQPLGSPAIAVCISRIAFMLAMSLSLTWVDVGPLFCECFQLVFRSAGWQGGMGVSTICWIALYYCILHL